MLTIGIVCWFFNFKIQRSLHPPFFFFFYLQEYNEILVKRIQQLQKTRHRPDQFTILVQEIPFCPEHKARGCSVDHFFSKHHPYTYNSYQMLYYGKDLEELLVRFE